MKKKTNFYEKNVIFDNFSLKFSIISKIPVFFPEKISIFLQVCPNDKDARAKFDECSKIVRRQKFEAAISTDHDKKTVAETLDINAMAIEDSYDGPRLEDKVRVENGCENRFLDGKLM